MPGLLWRSGKDFFLKYEGRPHWGKMHKLSYEQLQYIIQSFIRFLQVRNLLDELGMFLILMRRSYYPAIVRQ